MSITNMKSGVIDFQHDTNSSTFFIFVYEIILLLTNILIPSIYQNKTK